MRPSTFSHVIIGIVVASVAAAIVLFVFLFPAAPG
jgi:hypothetical protein